MRDVDIVRLFMRDVRMYAMGEGKIKRAVDMLLAGATLMAQPCPYCSGVRVIKEGHVLCVSCGSEPERDSIHTEPAPSTEMRVLELTRQLGTETDHIMRQKILEEITRLSGEMASTG